MKNTSIHNFNMPELNDPADITKVSENFETIDNGLFVDVGISSGEQRGVYIIDTSKFNLVSGVAVRFIAHKTTANVSITINGYRLYELSGSLVRHLNKNCPYMVLFSNGSWYLMNSSWFDSEELVNKVNNLSELSLGDLGISNDLLNLLKKLKSNGRGNLYLNDRAEYTDPIDRRMFRDTLVATDSGNHFRGEYNVSFASGFGFLRMELHCNAITVYDVVVGNISKAPFKLHPLIPIWDVFTATWDTRYGLAVSVATNGDILVKNCSHNVPIPNDIYFFGNLIFPAEYY